MKAQHWIESSLDWTCHGTVVQLEDVWYSRLI